MTFPENPTAQTPPLYPPNSAPAIEMGVQQVSIEIKAVSRGRSFSNADEKIVASAVAAFLIGIILVALGTSCLSNGDNCYDGPKNRVILGGTEFGVGISAIIYAVFQSMYGCNRC